MATAIGTDIHLHPLYAKWASDCFLRGNEVEAKDFFRFVCTHPREAEYKVYKQLWKIKGRPEGDPEFGRKTFHDLEGFSSTLAEKAQAISMAIRKTDMNELVMQENQVHKNLWIVHGKPLVDLEFGKHAFNNAYGRTATFIQKEKAAKNYAENSRVCRFDTSNFIVDVVKRENGELEFLIISRSSESMQSITPERGGRSVESMIDTIRNNFIIGAGDGKTPSFHNLQRCAYFPKTVWVGDKQLSLLQSPDNGLLWHAFDPEFKKVSWLPARNTDAQIINFMKILSEGERIKYANDHTAQSTWHEDGTLRNAFFSSIYCQNLPLPKISYQSLMDPKKTVDRDNWAVTLVNHGDSSMSGSINLDPGFGHSMIIYEGVKDSNEVKDKRFIKFAHLTGTTKGLAKVIIQEISTPKYNSKTPTWIRSRHLVELLEQEDEKTYLFNLTGNELLGGQVNRYTTDAFAAGCNFGWQRFDSVEDFCAKYTNWIQGYTSDLKANPDLNCLTWAKKVFEKMGIKLPDIPYLLAEPKRYVEYISSNPSLVEISN